MKWHLTLVLCIPLGMCAQQPLEVLPDAPTPAGNSSAVAVPLWEQHTKATPENKFEKRSFKLFEGLLVYSAERDLSTTNDFLHHPQYVEYRGVCGDQPCSNMSYGHNPSWFTEVGRPARFLGCGPRSVGCSLFAVTVNDLAIFGVAEFLHRRGKLGKVVAWGLIAEQLASNLEAWHHNKTVTLNERLYVPREATQINWYNPQ